MKATGFLKDARGRDVVMLPDEQGNQIVFDERVADCSCYVSADHGKAVIGTPWGNIILDIPDNKRSEDDGLSKGSDGSR